MATKITFELSRSGYDPIVLKLDKAAGLWVDSSVSGCLLLPTGHIVEAANELVCKASESHRHVVLLGAKWNGCPPDGNAQLND